MAISVGEAIPVGEYTEALGAELEELGAFVAQQQQQGQRGRVRFKIDPRAAALMKSIKARSRALNIAAQKQPQLKPFLSLTRGATSLSTAAMQAAARAAAVHRVAATRDWLEMPTHVIPVNFDNVGSTLFSGVATVTSPHNQPWRLIAIMTNDAQCTGIRFTSIKLANTEHVVTSNVNLTGTVNPGIDAVVFSGKLYRGLKATHQYRPWGLGRGGWLRSDSNLIMQLYNPTTASASLNVSLLVQSTPCGEGTGYSTAETGGVYPAGHETSLRMFKRLGRGLLSLWPRK